METTIPQNSRRLYKSRQHRIIDGVCGGIAEYFDVDVTIVRLLFVLVTLLGGTGLVLYIVAMIIMPVNPNHLAPSGSQPAAAAVQNNGDKRRFFGVFLILVGTFILLMKLGWDADIDWWIFSRHYMLPVLLILVGILFIYIQTTRRRAESAPAASGVQGAGEVTAAQPSAQQAAQRDLQRSRTDRKLFGVCGGLAKYFGIDSTLVRFVFVALVLASLGWGLLLYIILGILMPEEKPLTSA